MGCSFPQPTRSLSSPNTLNFLGSPQENSKFQPTKANKISRGFNSMHVSQIIRQETQKLNSKKIHDAQSGCTTKEKLTSPTKRVLNESKFSAFLEKADSSRKNSFTNNLNSNKNSIFSKGYDEIMSKMPTNNINISNSPINSFSKRKGSNVELQTHRSLTKHNNSKKANTNLELDIFLKNYSHDIDLRKFSESEIKPKFKLSEKINFFSPLIKHNKQVKDVAKSLTGKNQSNNDNPKVKMASVHNKIAMFLDKLSLKKTDNKKNNVNKNSHIYSLKKRDKQIQSTHTNWDEIDIPFNINREMLEKEQKEDAKMLYGFSKFSKNKSKLKSTVKEETKEILLHNLLTKYSLEKPKFKEKIFESSKMILKSQVFSPIFSNSSLVLNSAKKLKKNIIEPEPESPNLEYPTNHKEGVRITVYSKNAEKMQRNLNEKVNLDNVFKQGNLKLGKGQIKYVKNGRIYVFNLNENVILHKDKIIQIQNKNDNDKNKNETEDDLFTFLIKKNLSPTEYFFNKKQQSKNPYFKKT